MTTTLAEHITEAMQPGMNDEEAAIAAYSTLIDVATTEHQDPKREVSIMSPEQAGAHGVGKAWWVSWEAGPYMWGVGASLLLTAQTGMLVETYYGFDLLFWPEDR